MFLCFKNIKIYFKFILKGRRKGKNKEFWGAETVKRRIIKKIKPKKYVIV